LIDQFIELDGQEYEISDKKEMYMVTIKSSFVGYITKDGEYLGKTLPKQIVIQLKEAIL
jgi:hypothetical protein